VTPLAVYSETNYYGRTVRFKFEDFFHKDVGLKIHPQRSFVVTFPDGPTKFLPIPSTDIIDNQHFSVVTETSHVVLSVHALDPA
jgi:hypothetical protein